VSLRRLVRNLATCQNHFICNFVVFIVDQVVTLVSPNSVTSCSAETAQKILSPVAYAQGFHFFMPDGHYTGETATSLCSFLRDLGSLDVQLVKCDFYGGDFQKWIRNIIKDEELAQRIDKLDKNRPEEILQQQLIEIVQKRISELQLIDT